VLDAHGEADQSGRDASGELLFRRQLAVRRRRRMDDQTAHVTDVGDVAVQLQALDEPLAGLEPTRDLERQHGPAPLGRYF